MALTRNTAGENLVRQIILLGLGQAATVAVLTKAPKTVVELGELQGRIMNGWGPLLDILLGPVKVKTVGKKKPKTKVV